MSVIVVVVVAVVVRGRRRPFRACVVGRLVAAHWLGRRAGLGWATDIVPVGHDPKAGLDRDRLVAVAV